MAPGCQPGAAATLSTAPLILASSSATRARLLAAAGVAFTAVPTALDEGALKSALQREGASASEAALALAEAKARRAALDAPEALVIGCDQLLECEGRWFDKPAGRARARAQLCALRGREHRLHTAVAIHEGEQRVWHYCAGPRLWMRAVSDSFLDRYLDALGQEACESVGGYKLEGLGAQLFDRIEGDYFSILGLPLLPLLGYLRARGVLAS